MTKPIRIIRVGLDRLWVRAACDPDQLDRLPAAPEHRLAAGRRRSVWAQVGRSASADGARGGRGVLDQPFGSTASLAHTHPARVTHPASVSCHLFCSLRRCCGFTHPHASAIALFSSHITPFALGRALAAATSTSPFALARDGHLPEPPRSSSAGKVRTAAECCAKCDALGAGCAGATFCLAGSGCDNECWVKTAQGVSGGTFSRSGRIAVRRYSNQLSACTG